METLPSTDVLNLATLQRVNYSLEPREAVIAAWAQLTHGDYNWWAKGLPHSRYTAPPVIETPRTFVCGDWSALK